MITRARIITAGIALASCVVVIIALPSSSDRPDPGGSGREGLAQRPPEFVGSRSCRECHERFYRLWAPSHHGLAMQPLTRELVEAKLTEPDEVIRVRGQEYSVDISSETPCVIEVGSDRPERHPIVHAMGGKNVYYFLTPLERGRLQVLPVAYDVREKKWIDATLSMVRHAGDEPVEWRDPLLTFNTACFACHVSQVSTNYDPSTDTYHTTWVEPGINCETCHGPASEHIRVSRKAPSRQPPEDVKILSYKTFSTEQTNTTCASCHAKARPMSTSFTPGDRFFDHFDLVTYEDPDYHADGRDLGENYTYTSWLLSPCVEAGELSCLHCHTSSGRYRFQGDKANEACAPCHRPRVANAVAHHRHPVGKPGSHCVDCHMPTTTFARMRRSDHSMRPPTPAATLAFASPNACNICHEEEDATWADRLVREWHEEDYQAPVLEWARLIEAGRARDWTRLPRMLAYLDREARDPIVTASLIRLLAQCTDPRVEQPLVKALRDASPLVRTAAVDALSARDSRAVRAGLIAAAADECRVVRVRAAAELAAVSRERLAAGVRTALEKATEEYLTSLNSRLDLWTSHYNLGNYHMSRGELGRALRSFDRAIALRPDVVGPLVNAAMACARLGQAGQAGVYLEKAFEVEPANAAVNFNLGLLHAERGDPAAAESALRRALRADPTFADAAYNLGVLMADREDGGDESLRWCRQAWELRPDEPKFAFTLAFYLRRAGATSEAVSVLEDAVRRDLAAPDVYSLLGEILEEGGEWSAAKSVYGRAAQNERLPVGVRAGFRRRAAALSRDSAQGLRS